MANGYTPRHIRPGDEEKLLDMYHRTRARHAYAPHDERGRYCHRLTAAREYHHEHPGVSEMGAYKDLCGLLET